MKNNQTPLVIIFILIISQMMIFSQLTSVSMEIEETNNKENYISETIDPKITQTDLERVEYRTNNFPNRGFETWSTSRTPTYVSTYRSPDTDLFYASSPTYPVSNGSRSFAMTARGINTDYPSLARLVQQYQAYWSNPTNCSINFDYYIEDLPSALDYFEVEVRVNNHYMHYFLGNSLEKTNSSYSVFFMIDAPFQTFNKFDRNITSDYISTFGTIPTQFETINFYLISRVNEYSQVFLDNMNLLNNSDVVEYWNPNIGDWDPILGDGDFETGGYWSFSQGYDQGDISQSNTSHESNWSLNATVQSLGQTARATVTADIHKRLTDLNQDEFNFWWRIDDFANADSSTYAYIKVECENITTDFNIYYNLFSGENTPPTRGTSSDISLVVDDYNNTNQWNFFNTSIWSDINNNLPPVDDISVNSIQLYVNAAGSGEKLTVLIDEMSFISSTVNDGSYEDQLAIGTPIHSWGDGADESSEYLVTDFAYSGTKAGNLTLDDTSYYISSTTINIPFNGSTELIFDLNYYIDTFNESADETGLFIEINTDDEYFTYVIANSSSYDLDGNFNDYIVLYDTNTIDSWANIQLDLTQGYASLFGTPNTTLRDISVYVVSYESNTTIFFDDIYLYTDPAPEVTEVLPFPLYPEYSDSVAVSATVIDATLDEVILHYRVDSGTWNNVSMVHSTGNTYERTIPSQSWNIFVEYYISAEDAFNKTTTAPMYPILYSYTVGDSISPTVDFNSPSNNSIVSGVVEISISTADSGSGIDTVEVFINGTSILTETTTQFVLNWNTTTIEDGNYTVAVIAQDFAGNSHQSILLLTTDNPDSSVDLLPFMILIISLIIIAGVVIVFIKYDPRKK